MTELADEILAALESIFDPCSVTAGMPLDIVAMGLVDSLSVEPGGKVAIALLPTSPGCTLIASIMEAVERRVRAIDGVSALAVSLRGASLWSEERMSQEARRALADRRLRMSAATADALPREQRPANEP